MDISGLPYMLGQIVMNTVHTNGKGLIIPKKNEIPCLFQRQIEYINKMKNRHFA